MSGQSFTAILVLILAVCVVPAQAAKPKRCFSLAELRAEQEIRHGIYLREAAKRCDGRFLTGSNALWQKLETANATKFRAAMDKRTKAWQREFPEDWKDKINHADGRLVTYDRNVPLTQGFCDNIDELLQEMDKRGYGGFSAQAKLLRNEVIDDYKVCP